MSYCQIDRLKNVLNAAARVTQHVPRYSHLTPALKSLHWIPIGFRIEFKIALLVFKALKGMAPLNLSRMLQPKPTSRYFLRNNNENLLINPRTRCKTVFLDTSERLKTFIISKINQKDTFLKKLFIKNSNI